MAATYAVLRSRDVMLATAVMGNKAVPPQRRVSLRSCFRVAETLDLFAEIPEKVSVFPVPKKSGFRMVHLYGPMYRTAQLIVKRILEIHFEPAHFQYSRSVAPAVRYARKMGSLGFTHAGVFDIKDCYGSFEGEALAAQLPLPEEVVERVVLGGKENIKLHKSDMVDFIDKNGPAGADDLSLSLYENTLITMARSGIPQGSHCSPIVGQFTLAKMQWSVGHDFCLLNYVDDFLLLTRSAGRLAEKGEELVQAVQAIPGGNFRLVMKQSGSLFEGIRFLGYEFVTEKGATKIAVSLANQNKIYAEMNKLDDSFRKFLCLGEKGKAFEELTVMYSMAESWLGAFTEADDIEEFRCQLIGKIKENARLLGATLSRIKKRAPQRSDSHWYSLFS